MQWRMGRAVRTLGSVLMLEKGSNSARARQRLRRRLGARPPQGRLTHWTGGAAACGLVALAAGCAQSEPATSAYWGIGDGSVDSRIDQASHDAPVGSPDASDGPSTPMTCSQLGVNCGVALDGSGNKVSCGACPNGQVCGGGGPNKCGAGSCAAATCAGLGASCGQVSDGCSAVVDCGSCQSPLTCGGGGVENQCGCTPKTCAQLGAKCGTLSDGCSGTVTCTDCPTAVPCTKPSDCALPFCVDGVCCDSACNDQPCQRCDGLSIKGAGTCGYVNSDTIDPDNDCSTAVAPNPGSCKAENCSAKGYSCAPLAAGEQGQPTCKRCDGVSLDPVNVPDSTQDAEGSKLCNATCKKCSAGNCVDQTTSEDLFDQCSTGGCSNGNCNGTGACGFYTSGQGTCPACQNCAGATSSSCVNLSNYAEDSSCNSVCKGCYAGTCSNIPEGSKDTYGANTCTAEHNACASGGCGDPWIDRCLPQTGGQTCDVVCANAGMIRCRYAASDSSCTYWGSCSLTTGGYCDCNDHKYP
jgi:hypothetical protein